MFVDMFQDNTRPNVSFEIKNLPGDMTGGTIGETETDLNNRFNNKITIDTDLLTDGNNMEIVKTIIHECIHAFLNVKLADPNIGMNIPNLNNLEVAECLNEYYDNFLSNQSQHDFMYNYMLSTLQTILSEVKPFLISNTQNSFLQNNITVLQPLNTIPVTFSGSTAWNWNDYYKYLSLKGLERSQFFKSEIANLTQGLNIVNPVEYYLYSQYNTNAANDIDKNCIND